MTPFIPDSIVKSPTQTLAWLKCRQYWYWSRKLRPSDKALEGMILGRKVAKALELKLKGYPLDLELDLQIHPDDNLFNPVMTALEVASDISVFGDTVHAVEQRYKECRPDLVMFKDGILTIIDHKVTQFCKPSDSLDRIKTLEQIYQLQHYAWRVSKELNYDTTQNPVTVGVNYIILAPKPMRIPFTWDETHETLQKWLQETYTIWLDIHTNNNNLFKNIQACISKYGECDFYRACHIVDTEQQAINLYGEAQ